MFHVIQCCNLNTSKNQIVVLLWKCYTDRKRRIFETLWHLFCGISIFLILLLLRSTLYYDMEQTPKRLSENSHVIQKIFYHPNDEFFESIVRKAGDILLSGTDEELQALSEIGYWGFESKEQIYEYLSSSDVIHEPIAIILFQNDSNELNYTVELYGTGSSGARFHNKINLIFKQLLPEVEQVTPSLMKIEWAINNAYISKLTDQHINHDIVTELYSSDKQKDVEVAQTFLVLCTMMAPVTFYVSMASEIIVEKRTGLKELMKLVGVSPNNIRIAYLIDTGILGAVYGCAVTFILKVTDRPILPYCSGAAIFITMTLHYLYVTSLALVGSCLTYDRQHGHNVILLLYIGLYGLVEIWQYNSVRSKAFLYLSLFIPHGPMYLFWDQVDYLESLDIGVQFNNIYYTNIATELPVLVAWIYMCLQIILTLILAWYLDLVVPGPYGIPEKWNFLFKKGYCKKKKKKRGVTFHVTAEQNVKILRDGRFYQKIPTQADIAIKVLNVTKVFYGHRTVVALENVSFDVLKGEITVLLGSNGAGKTTLMSIITGMISATSGTVYINGLDISKRIQILRKDMGLCPDKNLTFDFLTVRENISFFERLKGTVNPDKENPTNSLVTTESLIGRLKLSEKENFYSHQLSTGTKRCLQVACSLVGGADVLVLDEPTSGMDHESRHALWDVLLELRGKRTILLSTTFLKEADALGDRVVILNAGKLTCHGTPEFLKQAIGSGFNLTVMLKTEKTLKDVQDVVESVIPSTPRRVHEDRRITFYMYSKDHHLFPNLLNILEEKKEELKILALDVGMSLEEVFLKFINEKSADFPEDYTQGDIFFGMEESKIHGWALKKQQLKILMTRAFIFIWRKKYQFILFQWFIPLIFLCIITITSNTSLGFGDFHDKITNYIANCENALKDRFGGFGVNESLIISLNAVPEANNSSGKRYFQTRDGNWVLVSRDVKGDFLRKLNRSRIKRPKNVVGIDIKNENKTVIYCSTRQTTPKHSANVINMLNDLYTSIYVPQFRNRINVFAEEDSVEPKSFFLCMTWAAWMCYLITLPVASLIQLPIKERDSGVRHCHLIAGCSPFIHWISIFLIHLAVYYVCVLPTVMLTTYLLDFDRTTDSMEFLVSLLIVLLLFGPAFIPHLYVLSFLLDENYATGQIYIIGLCSGLIAPILLYLVGDANPSFIETQSRDTLVVISISFHLCPTFTLCVGIVELIMFAHMNAFCKFHTKECLKGNLTLGGYTCCDANRNVISYPYLKWDSGLIEVVVLVVQFVVNGFLIALLQTGRLQNLMEHIANCCYKQTANLDIDPDVKLEDRVCNQKMKLFKKSHTGADPNVDTLLVHNLHKKYMKMCSCANSCMAVKGVSFCVKKGECLAILGPNCAGKTTTLNMIAGCTVMTRGDACIEGKFIRKDWTEYLHSISFTKMSGGLDEFQTGFENLYVLAILNGRPPYLAQRMTLKCLNFMGAQSMSDAQVCTLSVGWRRRLCICTALLAVPRVALFDEPTSSVDLHTRPLVARAMRSVMAAGATLLLAEDSMKWNHIESLCTRIAILIRGKFITIGNASDVHRSLTIGYTAMIKLKMPRSWTIAKTYHSQTELVDDDVFSPEVRTNIEELNAKIQEFVRRRKEHDKFVRYEEIAEESLGSLNESAHRQDLFNASRRQTDTDTQLIIDKHKEDNKKNRADETKKGKADETKKSKDDKARKLDKRGKSDEALSSKTDLTKKPKSDKATTSKSDDSKPRKDDNAKSSKSADIQKDGHSKSRTHDSDQQPGTSKNAKIDDASESSSDGSHTLKITASQMLRKSSSKSNVKKYITGTTTGETQLETNDTKGLESDLAKLIHEERIRCLAQEFKLQFATSQFIEKHSSVLYFRIIDEKKNIPYSEMFEKMEALMDKFEFIEDYVLSETSLSELFSIIEKHL